MELYNEQLFDLLSSKPRREDTIVELREDGNKGIKIPGLTEVEISSVADTMAILEKASEGRVTAATAMNARSSRSHAIFTLTIEVRAKGDTKAMTVSKFHLVDLAGSERQKKTKAKGDRLKEGININMGLLSLGNVISALGEENRGANSHIPYRDSKLTRLLQDSLGGNSHTLMIACVSPADSNLEETLSTLRYADRARKIKNKPIINKDPRSEEISRLRGQLQQLQLQLIGQGNLGHQGGQVDQELKEEVESLKDENEKITTALQAAMEENSHMSEKLLLAEQANDKLRTNLEQLNAQAEDFSKFLQKCENLPAGVRSSFEKLTSKVRAVEEDHKTAEKTMMNHDISRFASSNPSSPLVSPSKDAEVPVVSGVNLALKHSELSNQLSELNKVLAQEQELASKMGESDVKMAAMRKTYESTIQSMEVEISRLNKEKAELCQKQKADSYGQVSEMRRKKIQDLEEKIKSMTKQQAEQKRLLVINQQNELKIKKCSEEIVTMKQARVKLIKQMKEESERARQWKAAKEKEVYKLKQQEKKAQVKMSAMSLQHERRENVMKRKVEEANATSKRLKEAMAKKAEGRKMKESRDPNLLTGAGERVRGWITSEVDVVVSAKEAEMSKEQLMRERKAMSEELGKLKAELRKTLSEQERDEVQVRRDELQAELDLRNAQISDLQQQILGFENDKEKEKDQRADRWTRLASMVEAKLAAQFLFDQATEAMANTAMKTQELRELTIQLNEIRKNNSELREEKSQQRRQHDDEILRMEREHEDKVLLLLRQLSYQDEQASDVSLNKDITGMEARLRVQTEELAKMSDIHDQLLERDAEVKTLKAKLSNVGPTTGNIFEETSQSPVKTAKKKVTLKIERYSAEEYFNENFSTSEEESDDEDEHDEWRKTPLHKRIREEKRKSMGAPIYKRKRSFDGSSDEELESANDSKMKKKSSPGNVIYLVYVTITKEFLSGCTCKKGCKTKACSCRKAGPYCTVLCKCDPHTCAHR